MDSTNGSQNRRDGNFTKIGRSKLHSVHQKNRLSVISTCFLCLVELLNRVPGTEYSGAGTHRLRQVERTELKKQRNYVRFCSLANVLLNVRTTSGSVTIPRRLTFS